MPHFRIQMTNAEFESCDEGEYASLDAARRAAVAAAMSVASESIAMGKDTAAVELQIFDGDRLLAHQVVNLTVSELFK
jgi:hypothetical protein